MTPAVVFVVGSVAVLALCPRVICAFWFFFPREPYLFWMLLFAGVWFLVTNDDGRNRLRRHRFLYVALWVLG